MTTAPATEPLGAALAPLLEDRAAAEPADWADVVADVRSQLESAAVAAVAAVAHRPDVVPLRLPKARVLGLLRCPRRVLELAAHHDDDGSVPPARLRGAALDRFVAHEVHEGPTVDPVADVAAMFRAEEEHDLAAAVEDLDGPSAAALLVPLARGAAAWRGLPAQWWPRTQVRTGAHLAGGDVVCSGVVDVELGGPLAGLPGVVVEVKAGRVAQDHLEELTHYALLVALRDGVPPAAVVRWYGGGAPAVMEVGPGVVAQAADRLGVAIERWAALLSGERPDELAGPWCRWCPAADRCPTAAVPVDPFDEPDDLWDDEGDGPGGEVGGG